MNFLKILQPLLGESYRTSAIGGLGGILGTAFLVWLALAYQQKELLLVLIPLIPLVYSQFHARDQATSDQRKAVVDGKIDDVKTIGQIDHVENVAKIETLAAQVQAVPGVVAQVVAQGVPPVERRP